MPITFQGGELMPAYGTDAYNALSTASQNTTGNIAGNYNPTTGVVSTKTGVNLTPIYTPPSAGGISATTPVISSNNAKDDYAKKLAAYQLITQQINDQSNQKADQALLNQQTQAQKDLQMSEMNLKQQGIDIQKTQTEIQQKEAQAKADALTLASGRNTTPNTVTTQIPTVTPSFTPTTTNNQNVQSGSSTRDAANQGIMDVGTQFQQGLKDINDARDQITNQSVGLLNSVLQGTIPLSGPQQALIGSLQTQLQQNVEFQKQAKASLVGAVSQAAFRSGGEYTPEQMAGQIHNAISTGVAKIQMLDNAAATTIANLQIEFQKENYEVINKQYDLLTKQLDNKADAITKTYESTVKLLQDQRDYMYKQQQDSINNQLNSNKFTWQQKLDIADNAIKMGQLSIEQANLALNQAKLNQEAPQIKSINGVDMQWNPLSKKWESATISGSDTKSVLPLARAQDEVNNISLITTDPAIRSAVGPTAFTIPVPFTGGIPIAPGRFIGRGLDAATGARQNFIASVEQMRSNLNLEALIGAKARGATFGALSDQELRVLASSASKIGSWAIKDKAGNVTGYNASEKDFKKELDRINNFARIDYVLKGGDPMDVGAQLQSDGTYWVKNSDGSLTQIK